MDADPEPGNYGGPFWVTLDMPYIDYDFATGESGEPFDCRRPVNDSALNTGRRVLPPLVQPDVWYTYEDTGLLPELFQNMGGDGIGPLAGPTYQFNAKSRSRFKWPRYYHGVPLFYEWTHDYIRKFRLNRPNGSRLEEIRHVPVFVDNPMDMEFGPDGALYVWSTGTGSSRRTRTPSSPDRSLCGPAASCGHQHRIPR